MCNQQKSCFHDEKIIYEKVHTLCEVKTLYNCAAISHSHHLLFLIKIKKINIAKMLESLEELQRVSGFMPFLLLVPLSVAVGTDYIISVSSNIY